MTRPQDIRRARWTRAALAAASILSSAPAAADVVIGPDGTVQPVQKHRALLVDQGRSEVLVEELYLESSAERALWIKPVPGTPTNPGPIDRPFAVLDEVTTVREPHNEAVRKRVFGPSVVTLLTERFLREPASEPIEDEPGPVRDLEVRDRGLFTGTVYTSTITGKYVLPAPMQTWLRARGFTLPATVVADLTAHLNRGAKVILTLAKDTAPGAPGLARIGPVRVTMSAQSPVFPILRRSDPGAHRPSYELFVVGAGPLVPSAYSTLWDEEPWVPKRAGRGQFHTVYAQPLEETSALTLDLEERLGLALQASPYVVRSSFRQGTEALGEVYFEPAKYAVEIPSRGQRGDALDIFLCVLLGLTPLIYTPESWFLLWLGARARDRKRHGEPAFGHRLWPLYALAVAVYWGVTLTEIARLAAVLPLLVGLGLLVLPDGLRSEKRVRVDFKGKKKSSK